MINVAIRDAKVITVVHKDRSPVAEATQQGQSINALARAADCNP
jgi:hypothetical protein